MPLTEHLRELRSRLVKSGIAIAVGMVIGWIYYPQLFAWLSAPFMGAVEQARPRGVRSPSPSPESPIRSSSRCRSPRWPGSSCPRRCGCTSCGGSSPPGCTATSGGGPSASPRSRPRCSWPGWRWRTPCCRYGLQVLLGFTPENVENIVSVDRYLSFFLRTILVFGVGFLVPLLLVLLNFAGVLSGRRLLGWWRWIIIAVLLFAAVATPTGDPINLMLLAGPILVLVAIAVGIALLNDRRRARRRRAAGEPDFEQYDDDTASPLDDTAVARCDEAP